MAEGRKRSYRPLRDPEIIETNGAAIADNQAVWESTDETHQLAGKLKTAVEPISHFPALLRYGHCRLICDSQMHINPAEFRTALP